jgi:hypothetical protein
MQLAPKRINRLNYDRVELLEIEMRKMAAAAKRAA